MRLFHVLREPRPQDVTPLRALLQKLLTYFIISIAVLENVPPDAGHGPLKLRTVHFGDSPIIYENKVSKQNIFPWSKGTIE
jgi:hypothetical protein